MSVNGRRVLALQALGAEISRQRPVSITHPEHFVNVARRKGTAAQNSIFADQFENPANLRAHHRTGREILQQTRGKVDAFVCGAGRLLHGICRAILLTVLPHPFRKELLALQAREGR